jgi:hypothetical protein
MILTQYATNKKYHMSITALQKKAKKIPRPSYFIDVRDSTAPMIDEDNPEFKMYVELLKRKNILKDKSESNTDMEGLLELINKVITEEFGEKKALEIKFKIMDGM